VAAIATAQIGDLVGPQGGALTSVSTLDPILANFTVSEEEYLNAMRQIVKGNVTESEALRKLVWTLKLTDGSIYPRKGQFHALNRQVDIRTGTIQVQVQFPNPGSVLRPGGFGAVSTVVSVQKNALLVPQRAVSELQGGFLVAVVAANNKVTIRHVKMGSKAGDMWIVEEGLKPGDRVVTEGVQKVQDGTQVNPKPYTASSLTQDKSESANP
jgi:membrane fusion protein (multidrug efflux system)